jgi:thiol-disulfide isomerase/thioredoxin
VKRSIPALLLLLFSLLLLLNGCNRKKEEKNPFEKPQQHSEKNVTSHNVTSHIETTVTTVTAQSTTTPSYDDDKNQSRLKIPGAKTYLLTNPEGEQLEIAVDPNDNLHLLDNTHSIIILNFFSPWSYPCQSQLPYLVDLQRKYSTQIRIIGIVLNPHEQAEQLQTILKKTGEDLFISNSKENNAFTRQILKPVNLPDFMPIPLTVIYHNGIYYRHYEGAVPIEMIEHDIKTIMQ